MSGSPLQEFTTFAASQGPAWASSAETMVNEAAKRVYTLTRISSHKNVMEYCQGGDQIQDRIYFDDKRTWQRYNPNVDFNYSNLQTGTNWRAPWAFGSAHMTWTKHELGLNKDSHSTKFRMQKYKSVLFQKHQNLYTDICNSIEEEHWAVPDNALMEATTLGAGETRHPYSFPVFINEFENGLHSGSGSGAFTTVQGIDASAQTKWQPQSEVYGAGGADFTTAAGSAVIFAPLSRLARAMKFDRLPKGAKYSTPTTKPHVIFCSSQGVANIENALRLNQDHFRGQFGGQDADYNDPTFRGIPFEYIEELDTAAIYPTGTGDALSTELDTSNTPSTTGLDGTTNIGFAGPRYYMMNLEYFSYVVHSEYYMEMGQPFTPSAQPFTRIQVVDCWNNLICRSRRRGAGLLWPAGDITNA